MGIRVAWDAEGKSVLRVTYEESWNWKDHRIALDAINTLLSTVDHPVDLVVELQDSEPARATNCAVAEVTQSLHENWSGKVVVVSPSRQLAQRVLAATPALAVH
jgi:RNA polymerase subunit RPABC4/transcription elongation factor Spt4